MKMLFAFLFLAVLAFTGTSQTQPAPFKGATHIVVHTPDSTSVALKKLARLFVEQGFSVDKLDPDLGYLTTTPRSYGQISPAVFTYKAVATASPSGSVLLLSGEYQVMAGLQKITSSMHWANGNLSQDKQCWLHAEQAAKAYPGASLSYEKR